MLKQIIITFLIIFTPMAFIEQNKKHQTSSLKNEKVDAFHMIDKNNYQSIKLLFEDNEKNNFKIKNCWKEWNLSSKNDIAYLQKNLFSVYH